MSEESPLYGVWLGREKRLDGWFVNGQTGIIWTTANKRLAIAQALMLDDALAAIVGPDGRPDFFGDGAA